MFSLHIGTVANCRQSQKTKSVTYLTTTSVSYQNDHCVKHGLFWILLFLKLYKAINVKLYEPLDIFAQFAARFLLQNCLIQKLRQPECLIAKMFHVAKYCSFMITAQTLYSDNRVLTNIYAATSATSFFIMKMYHFIFINVRDLALWLWKHSTKLIWPEILTRV